MGSSMECSTELCDIHLFYGSRRSLASPSLRPSNRCTFHAESPSNLFLLPGNFRQPGPVPLTVTGGQEHLPENGHQIPKKKKFLSVGHSHGGTARLRSTLNVIGDKHTVALQVAALAA
eukprot:3926971-Rhodomonas_salina.1